MEMARWSFPGSRRRRCSITPPPSRDRKRLSPRRSLPGSGRERGWTKHSLRKGASLAGETRVREGRLREAVCGIFSALGVPESEEIADHLVLANLRGVDSHGVSRVEIYAKRLELGLVSKQTRVEVVRETPVSALVDGGNGSG